MGLIGILKKKTLTKQKTKNPLKKNFKKRKCKTATLITTLLTGQNGAFPKLLNSGQHSLLTC